MQRTAGWIRAGLVLLILFSAFAFLSGSLASLAVNRGLMLDKMEQYADTSASGVDKAEYARLADAITGYLRGSQASAQVQVQAAAGERPAFSEDELAHLSDIRGLIRLSGVLRWAAGILLVLSVLGYFLIKRRQAALLPLLRVDLAFRWAAWLFGLPLLLVIAWALIHFDSLFTAFHRLLFRNELWLLDPGKDLLLQLMPRAFFTSYLWELLKQNLFLLLALPLAAFGLSTSRKGAA